MKKEGTRAPPLLLYLRSYVKLLQQIVLDYYVSSFNFFYFYFFEVFDEVGRSYFLDLFFAGRELPAVASYNFLGFKSHAITIVTVIFSQGPRCCLLLNTIDSHFLMFLQCVHKRRNLFLSDMLSRDIPRLQHITVPQWAYNMNNTHLGDMWFR